MYVSASLSDAGNSQVFSESLPEGSASGRLLYDSLGGWQQVLAQKKTRTGARPDESALLPDVADILENAGRRHQLSLGTLCRVHELLTHTPSGIGGKIRDGPAIVRLNGVATFLPHLRPSLVMVPRWSSEFWPNTFAAITTRCRPLCSRQMRLRV
jgi:hypothetical protein